jgi:hypothetical protein
VSVNACARSCRSRRLEELINDERRAAADIFDIEFYRSSEDSSFELANDPYWVTRHVQETLIPDPSGVIDRLLPWERRRARLCARLIRQTNELVRRNVGSLHWAILQSLNDTFRKASSQFEERLDNAIHATKAAIAATLEHRHAGLLKLNLKSPVSLLSGQHCSALVTRSADSWTLGQQ